MKSVFRFEMQREDGVVVREYPYKEVQSLATRLGMDMEVDANLEWFLKQALITLLPSGWKRESDPKGRIQYHNAHTQATTGTHPLLFQYRCAFFRLLQRHPHPDSSDAQQNLFTDLVKEKQLDVPHRIAAMKDAENFYASIIRLGEGHAPRFIEETVEYQQASPQALLEMARRLGIASELRLYWVARMALALPLPPCFESLRDSLGNTKYMNTEYDVMLDTHPCLAFLQKQLVRIRTIPVQRTADIMFFYDKNFLPYVVDLQSLARGEPQHRINLDARGITKMRRDLFKAERDMREVIDDMMLLELVKCGKLEHDDIHLYGPVAEFIQELKEESLFEKWQFRYTLEGEHYWFHTPEERAYRQFPYAKALRRLIKRKRKHGLHKHPQYLRLPLLRHALFVKYGEDFYTQVRTEALDLMMSVLRTMLDTNIFRMPEEELDISETLKVVEPPLDKEQVLDLLFASPYDLTQPPSHSKKQDAILDVSTDSEILREAGFKLEGDKLVFVVAEPMERSGAFRVKKFMKTRIMPRRKEGPISRLKPEFLLPFQVQIGRVLRRLNSLKNKSKPEESSSPESSCSEEDIDGLPSLPSPPLMRAKTQLELLRMPTQLPITQPLLHVSREVEKRKQNRRSSMSDDEVSGALAPEPEDSKDIGAKADAIPVVTVKKKRISGHEGGLSVHLSSDAIQAQEDSAKPSRSPSSNYLLEHRPSKIVLEVVGTEKWLETSPRLKPTSERGWEGAKAVELGVQGVGKRQLPDVKSEINVKIPIRTQAVRSKQPSNTRISSPMHQAHSPVVSTPNRVKDLSLDTAPATSPRELSTSPRELSASSRELSTSPKAFSTSPPLSPANSRAATTRTWHRDNIAKDPMLSPSTTTTETLPLYKFEQKVLRSAGLPLSPSLPASPRTALPLLSERQISMALLARNQVTRESERSEVKATSSGRTRHKALLEKRMAPRLPDEGLPDDFVLSPRSETSRVSMRSEVRQPLQMRYFLHYLQTVGFPLSLQSELQQYPSPQDVQPKQVVLMGRRLGLRVSMAKLASVESDLLWIPLLQLSAPLPSPCDAPVTAALQVLLPLGRHPGDEFFHLMTGFNRKERVKELNNMTPQNRISSMIHDSWLRLSLRHQFYCYNFLTGGRIRVTSDEPERTLEKDQRAEYLRQFLESRTALDLASLLAR